MGVYIKGMEMPTSCCGCEWRDVEVGGDCELMICNPFKTYEEKYKHCPFQQILKRYSLVPVPAHGRLIDADALLNDKGVGTQIAGWGKMYHETCIEFAPTIIEAEEGE